MNPVAIQFGPFSIRWYAICIVFGLILAVILAMKEAPRKGIELSLIHISWLVRRLDINKKRVGQKSVIR